MTRGDVLYVITSLPQSHPHEDRFGESRKQGMGRPEPLGGSRTILGPTLTTQDRDTGGERH